MAKKKTSRRVPEDLNLNNIVSSQFDKAATHLRLPKGLNEQIRACNNVYYVQFPVKFGNNFPWGECRHNLRNNPYWRSMVSIVTFSFV